jgi:hypothetical protein
MTDDGGRTQIGNTPTCEDCDQPSDHCICDWVATILANDEASTDEELKAHFVANGITPAKADEYLAQRDAHLNNCCRVCGKPNWNGEGWDSMCGSCADRADGGTDANI